MPADVAVCCYSRSYSTFGLLVFSSASRITTIQDPVGPTCCILAAQRPGRWSAGLSPGLEWHISSCPVPGSGWNRSLRWYVLLEIVIHSRTKAKLPPWTAKQTSEFHLTLKLTNTNALLIIYRLWDKRRHVVPDLWGPNVSFPCSISELRMSRPCTAGPQSPSSSSSSPDKNRSIRWEVRGKGKKLNT